MPMRVSMGARGWGLGTGDKGPKRRICAILFSINNVWVRILDVERFYAVLYEAWRKAQLA